MKYPNLNFTDEERTALTYLQKNNITLNYPYTLSGITDGATTLKEVFFDATLHYRGFHFTPLKYYYSTQETRFINQILQYQISTGAYQPRIRQLKIVNRNTLNNDKIKGTFNRFSRTSKGIVYLTGLQGFTSDLCIQSHLKRGRLVVREFGELENILPYTLEKAVLPFTILEYRIKQGQKYIRTNSFLKLIYRIITEDIRDFTIPQGLYSTQEKRVLQILQNVDK